MNRAGSYNVTSAPRFEERGRQSAESGIISDVWVMNTIALGLVLGALALFIVGMLVGTGVTNTTSTAITRAEQGAIWLLGAISLAITAAIFRREHHVVGADEMQDQEEEPREGFYR